MEINKKVLESQNFIKFLEDERNNILYLKYLYDPSKKNVIELNEAYKKYERQLMVRGYIKKAIYHEAKKYDESLRNKEKQQISLDQTFDDGATLGDFLIDEKSTRTYEEMWDSRLEEIFENIKLYEMIINLTRKQRNVLYLLYIKELNEKEASRQLNVTQQAVSKVHRTAINKLKGVVNT